MNTRPFGDNSIELPHRGDRCGRNPPPVADRGDCVEKTRRDQGDRSESAAELGAISVIEGNVPAEIVAISVIEGDLAAELSVTTAIGAGGSVELIESRGSERAGSATWAKEVFDGSSPPSPAS